MTTPSSTTERKKALRDAKRLIAEETAQAQTLRAAQARYIKATAAAEQARLDRNQAITEALKSGMTGEAISRATGQSRQRISQLNRPKREQS